MKPVIHQIFNSSLVSGPETLVLPNLENFSEKIVVVLLQEQRLSEGSSKVAQYAESLGHEVFEIPVQGRFDWRAIFALAQYWRRTQPTIIHSHGPKAGLYSTLANFKNPKKFRSLMVTTHHGVRANDQSRKLRIFEKIYEKAVMPFQDMILTVCTSDRELLIKRGISAQKIKVHLNGTDRDLTTLQNKIEIQKIVRKDWSTVLNQDIQSQFIVGVVGRLSVEKQYPKILRSFLALQKNHPQINPLLLCFGSGALEQSLKALTKELGLEKHVHWMGYRRNIAYEMSGLDVLLSLSSAEGLPINLIEAGWAGIPVVAQAVDGVNDLIEDRKSGLLLSPTATIDEVAETVFQLAQSKEQSTTNALGLQTRVQKLFSKNAWVTRLNELYNNLLK